MDAISIQWVLEQIEQWFRHFREEHKAVKAEEAAAIHAFLEALNETQIYLGRIKGAPWQTERQDEEKLSRLWVRAAEMVRPINPQLAQTCLGKGEHWARDAGWRNLESHTKKASISIKRMVEHGKELLQG